MLLGRFITAQRAKEQWKLEIAQARHVQQVLIPNKLPELNDLHVESVYRPAREVGGDFFQIVPNGKDGSSLIAFGDVTGKGLQAGMLVALIIGAIRSAAEHDNDPRRMLEVLTTNSPNGNRRVRPAWSCVSQRTEVSSWRMQGSFLLISTVSRCRLRVRFRLESSPVETFRSLRSSLSPATRFLIMSRRHCRGTECLWRASSGSSTSTEMLRHSSTTAEIAAAAQKFGQTDDILVLRVQRHGARTALHVQPQEVYS